MVLLNETNQAVNLFLCYAKTGSLLFRIFIIIFEQGFYMTFSLILNVLAEKYWDILHFNIVNSTSYIFYNIFSKSFSDNNFNTLYFDTLNTILNLKN